MAPLNFSQKNLQVELDVGYNDAKTVLKEYPNGNADEFFKNHVDPKLY